MKGRLLSGGCLGCETTSVDTHTAILQALHQTEVFEEVVGLQTRMWFYPTASPYKFTGSVLAALGEEASWDDKADMWETYLEITGQERSGPLSDIWKAEVKHRMSLMWTRWWMEVKKARRQKWGRWIADSLIVVDKKISSWNTLRKSLRLAGLQKAAPI